MPKFNFVFDNTVAGTSHYGDKFIETYYFCKDTKKLLTIRTAKGNKNIRTNSSVSILEESGMTSHMMFKDWNALLDSESCSRVTEKKLKEFHDKVLKAELEELLVRVQAHYDKLEEKEDAKVEA